jgi:hypothetical protein
MESIVRLRVRKRTKNRRIHDTEDGGIAGLR